MTDDDKSVAFETAISLMLEAQERLSDASELFRKCGIELCDTFCWGDAAKKWYNFTNAQIHHGIKNFENLSETSGYFINDCTTGKEDKSRRYAKYNGLKFVQLMYDK